MFQEDKFLDVEEVPFYSGNYAQFYDFIMKDGTYDMEIYKSQANACEGDKVLELACGTGRVGIELAKMGYQVTGIDISEDMLSLYQEKVKKGGRRLKERIHTIKGDITNFCLDEKFDLIIFPAITICLFNDEQIQEIFKCVKQHLTEHGRFVLDRVDTDYSRFIDNCSLPQVYMWEEQPEYRIAWIQEFLVPEEKSILVNVYHENIVDGVTTRSVSYTKKRIITDNIIRENIEKAGLIIKRVIESNNTIDHKNFEFYILKKGE